MGHQDEATEASAQARADGTTDFKPRAARAVTTLLVGRLIGANGSDNLCRVRNLSATGMMLETSQAVALGETIEVELRNCEHLKGEIVWTNGGRAGVRFHDPIEMARMLAVPAFRRETRGQSMPRAPRFHVECIACISSMGQTVPGKLENLSQSGARLKPARPIPAADVMTIAIPGLPPRRCAVRWADNDELGLAFIDMVPFKDLAAWLGEHRGQRPGLS